MDELNIDMEKLKIDDSLFKDVKFYATGQLNDKVHDLWLRSTTYDLHYFLFVCRFWKFFDWEVQSK